MISLGSITAPDPFSQGAKTRTKVVCDSSSILKIAAEVCLETSHVVYRRFLSSDDTICLTGTNDNIRMGTKLFESFLVIGKERKTFLLVLLPPKGDPVGEFAMAFILESDSRWGDSCQRDTLSLIYKC